MAGTFSLTNKGKVALLKYSSISMSPVSLRALRAELQKIEESPEEYQALVLSSTDSKIFS